MPFPMPNVLVGVFTQMNRRSAVLNIQDFNMVDVENKRL